MMKKTGEKTLYKGKWLTFIEAEFENSKKERFKWECIKRGKKLLIMIIVPRLAQSGKYVLIRQFRCPVNNYVLGFPAGVTSFGITDNMIECEALRELKEETGYQGKVISKSPILKASSGIMDDDVIIIHTDIDEKMECNRRPVQSLEPEEEIEVITVQQDDIHNFIMEESKKGTGISAGIWYLFGMKL